MEALVGDLQVDIRRIDDEQPGGQLVQGSDRWLLHAETPDDPEDGVPFPHFGCLRAVATCADATTLPIDDEVADIVAVCETHVTDQGDVMTEEDRKFFRSAKRIVKPGGFFT